MREPVVKDVPIGVTALVADFNTRGVWQPQTEVSLGLSNIYLFIHILMSILIILFCLVSPINF